MAERLTIQKAIEYARQRAKDNRNEFYTFGIQICKQSAEEHEQLAEWLKDLQHYRDLEEQGRLITLPCKIGDTVYGIRRFQDRIVKAGTVSEMFYNRDGELIIAIKNVCRGCWGRQIFGTYEEAEAALKGAENAVR